METLLPSEIARLVLGYLEETECLEVAKMFLETSSYLQECRSVALHGKKFSTKVYGLTLTYILEKFWSINTIIQDRLSKLEEYEQLKNCKDLTEQLKLLIDVSRGQRFFVNINVPSQASQSSNVSPIVASSTKKRRHSELNERDRCKRALKISLLSNNEQLKTNTNEWYDATKHVPIDKASKNSENEKMNFDEVTVLTHDKSPVQCSSTVSETEPLVLPINLNDESFKSIAEHPKMYSTATDTLELMQYATAEVQTALDDIESESDSTDTPVENLSLLTKELLNRTELHERIAEKINKVLPTDSLMKDSSITEIAPGELNTSIMTELNNAIKSIVTATETDPVFEDFLHEIIGPNDDDEISPNKNNEQDSVTTNRIDNDALNYNLVDNSTAKTERFSEKITKVTSPSNNSSPLIKESTDDKKNNTEIKNKETPLDDYNAAAIQSIIDANNLSLEKRYILNQNAETNKNCSPAKPKIISVENISIPRIIDEIPNQKIQKKSIRKSRVRQKCPISNDQEIVVPTLIVCSKEEIVQYLEPTPSICKPVKSQFISIAPKISQALPETVYLRTVNVPQRKLCDEVKVVQPLIKHDLVTRTSSEQSVYSALDSDLNVHQSESITLYGSENHNSTTVKSIDMPTVSIEDSATLSGTGLSPYLKLNKHLRDRNSDISNKNEDDMNISQDSARNENCDILTKRTPKSLLKSRSKNCRLSLSTPRRRKSHVRTLNFNTPTENSNNNYGYNADINTQSLLPLNVSKPLCRTNLFMSPSFQEAANSLKFSKTLDKVDPPLLVPTTIKSPVPILKGGWDKVSGVGSIIKYSSSQSDSDSPPKKKLATEETVQRSTMEKTWDADLRNSLYVSEKLLKSNTISTNITENKTETVTKNENSIVIELEKEEIDNSYNERKTRTNNSHAVQNNNKSSNYIIQKTQEQKRNSPNAKTISTIKGVVKKYAKLKTIATKISENGKKYHSLDIESNTKFVDITETYQSNLSNMIDLETPRKTDTTFGIPPTPRVLSPNNTSVSITQVVNEDSTRVQSFVSTPEFPPTPNINLTPQETLTNKIDTIKKNFSAPYYQPSSELITRINKIQGESKSQVNSSKVMKESSNDKLEITQFEVIKENLPKESGSQELKISTLTEVNLSKLNEGIAKDDEQIKTANDSSENDSSSSSSCSSSSSSSISCYSCNVSNTSSKTLTKNKIESTPKKFNKSSNNNIDFTAAENSSNDSTECLNASNNNNEAIDTSENNYEFVSVKNNSSPVQALPVKKVNDTFESINIETPEKNETLLTEANISETPVCSKSGVENLTNLTAKISELITAKPLKKFNDNRCEEINVSSQNNNNHNKKQSNSSMNKTSDQIRLELNEKRLRIMKKLNPKVNININSSKQVAAKQKDFNVNKNNKSPIIMNPNQAHEEQKNDKHIKIKNDNSNEILNKNNVIELLILRKSDRNTTKNIRTRPHKFQEKKDKSIYHRGITATQTQQKNCTSQLSFKNNENKKKYDKQSSAPVIVDNTYIEENNGKEKIQKNYNVKKIQDCIKSKVDMVKRDLFSDEENNEATNLKSKQFCTSKSIKEVPQMSPIHVRSSIEFLDSPEEKLGVLESLKLVPSNKCTMPTEVKSNTDISSRNHLEIVIFHDETVNKRRRRKLNTPNFNFKVQTGDENDSWIQITATPFEEIFTMIPFKSRSRKINNNTKSIKNTIKSLNNCDGVKDKKLKKSESIVTPMNSHPLATSSPIGNKPVSKIIFKNETVTEKDRIASEENENNKNNKIFCNSKTKDSKYENEMLNSNNTAILDPKVLLKQVDINKFLTEVHGPET